MTQATPDPEPWRRRIADDLWGSVVPFWLEHSLDREYGGYLNQLDRDGSCFGDDKHVWLQGRQVWMFSKLFLDRGDERYLEAARLGAEFLARHAVGSDGRAFFQLRRDGAPVKLQRKIFSECFLVMAYAEFARASGDGSYRARALELFDRVLALVDDPTPLGRPVLSGARPTRDLAVPMILLNLVAELRGDPGSATFDDRADYDAIERRCVADVLLHFDRARGIVREQVGLDGTPIDAPEGRLLNPGHVIEAGWFMAEHAARVGDAALEADAFAMMEGALDMGWDTDHGGLYYFLDAGGHSPTQLEWSMKLWWPHCEAMIGTLIAWRRTGEARWWARFEEVASWAMDRFPDPEHGEWFGYLTREGAVSQRFKAGPYKGCFHVPRALWMCERLLAPPAD
ncbi:MAG: AGE family epimerase/isomerase [Planctomycetota bacterium]|nr:AGE family epimerase/isomerase [Planctomycetota bacterium]